MGLWKRYFALDNEKKLDKFAFVCIGRDWSYFISDTSSLKPGLLYARYRLRKVYDSPNVDPVSVEFDNNHPRVDERYYYINSNIDESNHTSQDGFQLDRKLHTKYWIIKVNTSTLVMDGVDTYYLGKSCE